VFRDLQAHLRQSYAFLRFQGARLTGIQTPLADLVPGFVKYALQGR
jgi:hypothetical protein